MSWRLLANWRSVRLDICSQRQKTALCPAASLRRGPIEELDARFVGKDGTAQNLALCLLSRPGDQRPDYSRATRRGGLQSRSCRCYQAERDLAPRDARGRTSTRMNLIVVTAKSAKQKRSPYSRGLSLPSTYNGFCKK
jgi:hypothetical protein